MRLLAPNPGDATGVFCVCSVSVDVDSRPPPIIYHGPQNQTLPVNSVATLSCSASGEPAPVISWYRNQRIIPSRDHRFTILQSGALQITGNAQNPSDTFPRRFPVDGAVANLLRTC